MTDREFETDFELALVETRAMVEGFGPAAVALTKAIQEQWPNAHRDYWVMIDARYRKYKIPADLALAAVRAGYSSPATAINAGLIGKKYMLAEFDSIRRASDIVV